MKKLALLVLSGGIFLASCGQQSAIPSSADQQSSNNKTQRQIQLQPASSFPEFLNKHPDIKDSLESKGILQDVLDQASKGSMQPQQTTPAGDVCTIDYGTDVINGDYVGGQAILNCSSPFGVGTSLEVITNRQPNFGQIDGLKQYQFSQWPQTSMFVSTNGSFPNERGQTYCTNSTAFIALLDGRYAASQQGAWDCMAGY